MKIKLKNNLIISKKSRPLIIAEISGNHNGDKKLFLKHIIKAAKNGADLVKIQTYEPQDITLNNNEKKFKIKNGIWKNKNLWSLYRKAQTPFRWHHDAFKIAKKNKINLFSTPFSLRAVDFLEKFNVPLYKISSFELNDYMLVNKIASTKKPIIISTGTSNFKEISAAIKIIEKYHKKIIILHCVSGYPTKEEDMNLLRIKDLQNKFKRYIVGLSDHTNDINTSLASIPLGAKLIEKHFIISNKIKSEDALFSINPNQLAELKKKTKIYFHSVFDQKENKIKINNFFKRSLFFTKNLKKNSIIKESDIISLRPFIGVSSSKYLKVIGKRLKRDVKKESSVFSNLF